MAFHIDNTDIHLLLANGGTEIGFIPIGRGIHMSSPLVFVDEKESGIVGVVKIVDVVTQHQFLGSIFKVHAFIIE